MASKRESNPAAAITGGLDRTDGTGTVVLGMMALPVSDACRLRGTDQQ
jgi:hypothetical protein